MKLPSIEANHRDLARSVWFTGTGHDSLPLAHLNSVFVFVEVKYHILSSRIWLCWYHWNVCRSPFLLLPFCFLLLSRYCCCLMFLVDLLLFFLLVCCGSVHLPWISLCQLLWLVKHLLLKLSCWLPFLKAFLSVLLMGTVEYNFYNKMS